MLQKLRDQTQSTGFKILVAAIIVVLTLFGFGASNVFMNTAPDVARVGDFDISQAILEAETEREYRRLLSQMGSDFDTSQIDRVQLQQFTLQQLISREVLSQTAQTMGVRVSDAQVNEQLYTSPAYQVDGQFNEGVYRQQVQLLGYSPVTFVAAYADALSSEQMRDGVTKTASVSEWELAEIVRVVNQKRDIAFLPLTVENFSTDIAITDDEIARRYEEDQALYMTELAVDVAYVALRVEDLLQAPEIEVLEEDLLSLYEEDKINALADEQRDSAHILVQINDDRSQADALELITEIAARLNEGEAFEDLAKSLSEDPGSAANGGALGAVGKGIFDPAFEQALWALQSPGDVSPPVKSAFGYHLIRLNNIVEAEYPSFADQRADLVNRVRREQAESLFVDQALALERAAYEERFSLDSTAQSLGLQLQKAAAVRQGEPPAEGVLANQQVVDALFELEVLDGLNSSPIELNDEMVVIARVDNQYPPEQIALEDVAEEIRTALVEEQARAAISQARETGLVQLQAGESVAEIALDLGSRWETSSALGRSGAPDVPREVVAYAFELPRPTPGNKSVGAVDLVDGAALVTVTRVIQGNINSTLDHDITQIRQLTSERGGRLDFRSFFLAAENEIGVERPDS